MSDETDYYGELWSAIKEQERLLQARRLVEGLKAFPTALGPQKHLDCLSLLYELLGMNQMEVMRRKLRYDQTSKGAGRGD
jgi:hypothetical protein